MCHTYTPSSIFLVTVTRQDSRHIIFHVMDPLVLFLLFLSQDMKIRLQQNHFWLFCLALQTAVSVPSNMSQGDGAVIIISIVIAPLFSSSKAHLAPKVSMNSFVWGRYELECARELKKEKGGVCVWGVLRGNLISTIRVVLEERNWCVHNPES